MIINQKYLKDIIVYNQRTGIFRWKITRPGGKGKGPGVRARAIAGSIGTLKDPARISIDGRLYLAHRLVWLYVHGRWPNDQIDHINGVKNDNRIINLREANQKENSRNAKLRYDNAFGLKGIGLKGRRWYAVIKVDRRKINLGWFNTPEAAHEAYRKAARKYFGKFARFE